MAITRVGNIGPLGAVDLIEDKDAPTFAGGGDLLLLGAGSWLLPLLLPLAAMAWLMRRA